MVRTLVGVLMALTMIRAGATEANAQRRTPAPLSGHPGNVFVRGESVTIDLPDATGWQLVDDDGKELGTVPPGRRRAGLGTLPVGFYRLRHDASSAWISLAVLEPLRAPTPLTSPIALDAGMAWFYQPNRIKQASALCALAGVNRVRDRLTWGQMEPERGRFEPVTRYDSSINLQAAAGLQVLTVNHSSPPWANPDGARFPLDLRDAYKFYREVARRWAGKVAAFEPWNEADNMGFGGHTGAEMAAMQKASYLGLKAGNPAVTACLNVFSAHVRAQLRDLADNEAWPYFDTYNLHHYEPFEGFPGIYADHRAVSAGRPLWVTECSIPVQWSGDSEAQEPSDADLRIQAERVAKVYAGSLYEGAEATFYFMLGHYVEGRTQFGIVRRDLTPRPAYVALAAVGRLLADARPMGRLAADPGVQAYVFRARPDGREQAVIVAWAEKGSGVLRLPGTPSAVLDHLGRPGTVTSTLELTEAPQFALLPSGSAASLRLIPPPAQPRRLPGSPSPVVLQVVWPRARVILLQSAYKVSAAAPTDARLVVYNFGASTVKGTIRFASADGWRVEGLKPVWLAPLGRVEIPVRFVPGGDVTHITEQVRFLGQFGSAGRPEASVRLAPQDSALTRRPGIALPGAADPAAWELLVSGGPAPTAVSNANGVTFEAAPSGDPWFYPRIKLPSKPPVPAGAAGLACTVTLLEGEGQFRAIFDEANGSSYVSDLLVQPRAGVPTPTIALFEAAAHGDVWSAPDPKGALDPSALVTLKIGCNSKAGKVRFRISDVRWVKR